MIFTNIYTFLQFKAVLGRNIPAGGGFSAGFTFALFKF